MSCEKYREALIDAAAIEGATEAGLAKHLTQCSECRAIWQRERALFAAIDGALRGRMNECPHERFLPRIRARIAHACEAEPEAGWNPRWAWAWAGAAFALLALAIAHPWTVLEQPPVDRSLNGVPVHVSQRSVRQNSDAVRLARGSTGILGRRQHFRRVPALRVLAKQSAPREPEVLVPPDEANAFAQFVARVAIRDEIAEAIVSPAKDRATSGNAELREILSVDVADLQEPLKWEERDEGWALE